MNFKESIKPANTNNEINSRGKNHETYTLFSAVLGGQHLIELTTFSSAHPNIILNLNYSWLTLTMEY